MIGPAIATDSSAGITVMNGASSRPEDQEQQDEDEEERGALHLVAGVARLLLLVDVDGELPGQVHLHARRAATTAVIAARRLSTRSVSAPWSLCRHVGQHLELRRLAVDPVRPGHRGLAELAHLRHGRHLAQVGHQGAEPGLVGGAERPGAHRGDDRDRHGRRARTPSGAARFAACSLGALAGRKALLLPCVTLASDGSAFGIATAAAIQSNNDYPAELNGELTNRLGKCHQRARAQG